MPRVGKDQNGDGSAENSNGVHHESPESQKLSIQKLLSFNLEISQFCIIQS